MPRADAQIDDFETVLVALSDVRIPDALVAVSDYAPWDAESADRETVLTTITDIPGG